MELSNFTMQVLKNFASINSNIVIHPGNTIMTVAEAKNILVSATVEETFHQEMGVYDLAEFLWPDDKELSTFFRHEKYIPPPPEEEEKVVVEHVVTRTSPPWKVTYTKSKFQSLRITPN